MKSRFCFQVMLLAVLLSSPVVAQVDSARYGEFKDRKAAVRVGTFIRKTAP